MLKVFKYPVNIAPIVSVDMPKGATLLSFQLQGAQPCLWALVDPFEEKETREFRVVGTGHDIEDSDSLRFVGTIQMMDGILIWHLFAVVKI